LGRRVQPVALLAIHAATGDSPVSLKSRITDDMKAAMRAGEKEKLGVIRLILAAIKQREVDERIELDDAQVMAVLEKMLKQRKDSIAQYDAANRQDLADVERYELGIIEAYLPQKLDAAELEALVDAALAESGAQGPKDMGKVVGLVKTKAAGRADMGQASELIKRKLAAKG
jgi:uncharacterized protein